MALSLDKSIPTLDIDFYGDQTLLDPFPVYAELRKLGPVVYLEKHNLYALSRYKEVSEVLRQPLRYISSKGISPIQKVNDILIGSTLNSDPPLHDHTRAVTSEPLLPGALTQIEPRIKLAADGLINTLCARGEFDAVSDLSQYLPVTIVAELVGLPDAAGASNMLKWASATFNLFGDENERTKQAFDDLKDLRDFLLEYGTPDKLKEGGWAKRIFEVGPERGLSTEACAQLMRDYINPSLDTTISATGQLIKLFADNPDQWDLIRKDKNLIPNAIEEAVRLATPIRAFTRYVNEDSNIAGHDIEAGARVLVIYASANRDERKYEKPDTFDITRDVHDHVGFGQGVHMCMGMHLARREMILLVEALRLQVHRFELLESPVVSMNNVIRAYSHMPIRVHCSELDEKQEPADQNAKHSTNTPNLAIEKEETWIDVIVSKRETTASNIISIEFERADGKLMPAFFAGAHVDVQVHSGMVRQYSICSSAKNLSSYTLGVQLEPNSKGGSKAIHKQLVVGKVFKIGQPRNQFGLDASAKHHVLFAGGIGITPLLSMVSSLKEANSSWELHYCAQSADRVAFKKELAALGDNVHLHIDDQDPKQRLNIEETLQKPIANQHIYVCGPPGFIDFVCTAAHAQSLQPSQIHFERFGAEVDTTGEPFTVVAAKSGQEIIINPGETIAQKLHEANIAVPISCQSGVCGTCAVRVLEGIPNHRDLVLTDAQKASNSLITVCCSRSNTHRLVLDV